MKEPAAAPTQPARLSIGFVLVPGFTLSAYAGFADVLRLAADEGDRSRPILCRWSILSGAGEPIRASCGARLAPDEALGDPARFDYVAVIGGLLDEIETLGAAETAFLRRAATARVPLAGVCTGAFALHRIGLLQGYRCCVSWFHHDDFLDRFEGIVPVSDEAFVVDRDRLTCAGGVASAQLAAFLVDRHIGRATARKALRIMIIDETLGPGDPQPGLPLELATRDPLVRRALSQIQQHLAAPPGAAEVAGRLGVGRRTLERRFAAATGLTPAEAFMRLRLAHAKLLLGRSGRSVAQIAAETGFCDASHLIRAFRKREGVTPDAWRRGLAV
ncbi:AraC family transcriptional regulator with amidase-like domain [Hasllibacter halocynthiae]|uniref:AraC family transcriptional regulator with amidase-like domain n=1 Tax=Hasllibacter halocynthiae TaxID=595589 RepID=A0A2T0X9X8_9RHOB|nr:GlxA family transcriptional regulator [Hasllibacter halocynthiae]PRY95736.1 AraC family transcriptional regulator with amidase-like domain [Hasllibacter halocynthiae]